MDDYFWDSFNPEYDGISDMILQRIIDKNKIDKKKCRMDAKKSHIDTNISLTGTDVHIDPTYLNKAIKRAIFSNPATIILWNDGTKTVTKCCDGDTYDPEIGMAMCIMKHLFGDTNRWRSIIRKYVKKNNVDNKKDLCNNDYTKLKNKPVINEADFIPSDDEYQIISCIISKDDKSNEDS